MIRTQTFEVDPNLQFFIRTRTEQFKYRTRAELHTEYKGFKLI